MQMSKVLRFTFAFILVAAIVAGSVLSAGCGKSKSALVKPDISLFQFSKGATVDFDDATINSAADGAGEPGFKFGIAKAIYPTLWATYGDNVAAQIFPSPYWKGDGVHTMYAYLSSGDQSTVDGTIFATKLSAAEQAIVTSGVSGFFSLYSEEVAAADNLTQNTAYTVLYYKVTASAANAWKTDAAAWVTALNSYAAANYSGKTYAQLTYIQRKTVEGIVFAKGAGTINPEYAFWRAMVQDSFRNGTASATYPDKRDALASSMYGKAYSQLDCVQKPTVDGYVYATCNVTEQAVVNNQVAGLFTLATAQNGAAISDNQNIYYQTLKYGIPSAYTTDNDSDLAAANWLLEVNTTPGISENTTFYNHILGGQGTWKEMLAQEYFGASYATLSTASQAVIDQADVGMDYLSIAQRSPAMPLTSNLLYQTLYGSVSSTAAEGWKTDVTAGVDMKLSFYKWLAYESFRNGTAATFYPTQVAAKLASMYPGRTADNLTSCETMALDYAVWVGLGAGEQAYATSAVSGMWGLVQAQMSDAFARDQTTLAMTLSAANSNDTTSVVNWMKDVDGGMTVNAAFYRWLAKESLLALKGLGTLIRLSEAEFLFKVTNPNKYPIILSGVGYSMYVNSTAISTSAVKVDTAKVVAADDIWVPAKSDLIVSVKAPVKQMGIITWLVAAHQTPIADAQKLAADVWSQYAASTPPTWIIEVDATVSNDKGEDIQPATYKL